MNDTILTSVGGMTANEAAAALARAAAPWHENPREMPDVSRRTRGRGFDLGSYRHAALNGEDLDSYEHAALNGE